MHIIVKDFREDFALNFLLTEIVAGSKKYQDLCMNIT